MAEMKRFTSVDTSVLKQHYEKKVHELELEKRVLQKEIEDLRQNLANLSSISDDGAQKLKEKYLQKLNVLEAQVSELKKKQDAQAQLLRQKQKSDKAAKRLQGSTPAEDQARIRAISAMECIKRKRGSSAEDCKRCSAIQLDWQCYRCCVNCRCFLEILEEFTWINSSRKLLLR